MRVDDGVAAPGSSFTVPVLAHLPAGQSLSGTTSEIRYDPSVLRATACNVDPNSVFNARFCNPNLTTMASTPMPSAST